MASDHSTVRAVCQACAIAAGYTPKKKVVGVWMGKCGICHQRKPCTDLQHDWEKAGKEAPNGKQS